MLSENDSTGPCRISFEVEELGGLRATITKWSGECAECAEIRFRKILEKFQEPLLVRENGKISVNRAYYETAAETHHSYRAEMDFLLEALGIGVS